MAMAILGLMMAHQVAGKATRDGIFLSQFSSSALPTMVAVAAIAAMVLSILRARDAGPARPLSDHGRVARRQRRSAWRGVAAPALTIPRIAACVIYLHVVAFGAMLLRDSGR